MKVIFAYLSSLFHGFVTLFKYIIWLISGVVNLGAIMTESVTIMGDVMQFFPSVISSTLVAMLGGLVVLRILGRS